jgi:hypothetical protein
MMASPPLPPRRWLLEGAGRCWSCCLSARADRTASTAAYDQAASWALSHIHVRLQAWADSQAIEGGPRGRERLLTVEVILLRISCARVTWMKYEIT